MNKYWGIILVFQAIVSMCATELSNEKKSKLEKIIRGKEVYPRFKYPYQAFYAAGAYKCAGTVIGRRHVLTADHCIKGSTPNSQTYVIVGHHTVTSAAAYGSQADAIFGSNLIRVKRFIRRNGRNREDIGILELERDIQFSNRIQPACIPVRDAEDYVGKDAVVSGWGGTIGYNPGNPPYYQKGSDVLLETTLTVLSPKSRLCRKAFGSADYKLCGYREGHDTCQGDSGGPMTIKENGKFILIGVTSSGRGCGAKGHAGIYTRVSYFHNWIKKNVRDVCTSQTVRPITIPATPPTNSIAPTPTQPGCSCSDFINPDASGGRCKKGQSSAFGGSVYCYVNLPSTCTDYVASRYYPGKWYSAEACQINSGNPSQPQPTTQPSTGCSCSDFVNKNGFGLCKKSDSDFGGLFSCYVNLPSTCTDLVQSGSNPGKYLSSEPCVTTPSPSTSRPYIPRPYPSSSQLPSGLSVTVRCGSCLTLDSSWCRPGEIQFAETCGKCPTQHGWFYCGGEFNDCRITGQGMRRNCQIMGSFKQKEIN